MINNNLNKKIYYFHMVVYRSEFFSAKNISLSGMFIRSMTFDVGIYSLSSPYSTSLYVRKELKQICHVDQF